MLKCLPEFEYFYFILQKFDSDNLLRFTEMLKCLPEFEYFYFILEK